MEVCRRSSWLLLIFGFTFLAVSLQGVQGQAESEGPSESECRPYIEKALKELETGEVAVENPDDSREDVPTVEITTDDSAEGGNRDETHFEESVGDAPQAEGEESAEQQQQQSDEQQSTEEEADTPSADNEAEGDSATEEDDKASEESPQSAEAEGEESKEGSVEASPEDDAPSAAKEDSVEEEVPSKEQEPESTEEDQADSKESKESKETTDSKEEEGAESKEEAGSKEGEQAESQEEAQAQSKEKEESKEEKEESKEEKAKSKEEEAESKEERQAESKEDTESKEQEGSKEGDSVEKESEEPTVVKRSVDAVEKEDSEETAEEDAKKEESQEDGASTESGSEEPVEDDLTQEVEIPEDLRSRDHLDQLLKLDDQSMELEKIVNRVADITLRDLKRLYENAIKPLEVLYKYRDLSNRHFGDPEIFSKPLVLFMGPWSGGKSSIVNYLLNNEYNETSLRTGAEPSPAYFNILMHGDEPEVLDGTQLAADFTFSGLQKFGQGLEERLRGHKLPSKLLEKVNIVEIPGILEVRKQISRVFPFNDACQWFIDRADIIFLVYDPSKLDVGPETEAILDQLKGREHQTRIILNKADQVKPEELMRVQGALIWNISPLMSSAQPPIMYTTSLWSRPYKPWAPVRLLHAQERAFLRDLRSAYDHRIENKIASARRFAVRVRNHAKMVDCYLTTYYNHKSVFGNRKQVADLIIEHPQDYHIYEGLSTLTNISRYDLPDPDVYKDFFRLNPLYEFQQLSATCTYFRGCPINRLDVAIAYDLPELVGKHRRMVEAALAEASPPDS